MMHHSTILLETNLTAILKITGKSWCYCEEWNNLRSAALNTSACYAEKSA